MRNLLQRGAATNMSKLLENMVGVTDLTNDTL
jgi:hypothetical protein